MFELDEIPDDFILHYYIVSPDGLYITCRTSIVTGDLDFATIMEIIHNGHPYDGWLAEAYKVIVYDRGTKVVVKDDEHVRT